MSRGSAAFSRRRGHLAVVSRAVVTVVSRQSWLSRESWLPFNSRVSQAEYKGHPTIKVRILKMDSPKGKTPQTEITRKKHQNAENGFPPKGRPRRQKELFNKSQNPENGFPRRGDPTDRKSLYLY